MKVQYQFKNVSLYAEQVSYFQSLSPESLETTCSFYYDLTNVITALGDFCKKKIMLF